MITAEDIDGRSGSGIIALIEALGLDDRERELVIVSAAGYSPAAVACALNAVVKTRPGIDQQSADEILRAALQPATPALAAKDHGNA